MSEITIRRSRPTDATALDRLAALDSRRVPSGDLLVAEVCGTLVAAHSDTGTIADPFRATADVVHLLRVRSGHARAPRRTRLARSHPRLRAA